MDVHVEGLQQVRDLVEEYRERCLWFMRPDYLPSNREEADYVLRHIEQCADRHGFVRARELRAWLSTSSK